jgi:hypothetical protein
VYDSILLECHATSLSEWCLTFCDHHTALKQWAPITQPKRETSDMDQLLQVPSARNLNWFFSSLMNADISGQLTFGLSYN